MTTTTQEPSLDIRTDAELRSFISDLTATLTSTLHPKRPLRIKTREDCDYSDEGHSILYVETRYDVVEPRQFWFDKPYFVVRHFEAVHPLHDLGVLVCLCISGIQEHVREIMEKHRSSLPPQLTLREY